MDYLLGIDIGTSGTKTVLFDTLGGVIASHMAEYPLSQPQNGWAEQEPEDWWRAVQEGIQAVLAARSGVRAEEIRGVGLSGQMHGLVLLDGDGAVLRPSILWCDQRTGAECAEITARVGYDRLIAVTANPTTTGFTAGKLLWVRKHQPKLYEATRHVLLPKDFIRYKLTGEFATEVSDASGTSLLDVPGRCWSGEILAALEIDRALLPTVHESPEISGAVTAAAAKATGLKKGTPVVGGAGDNAAAAVGTGVVKNGTAFATIGTSGVVYTHTDTLSIDPQGRVHTFCCAVPGAWHVMGVTQAAGLSLQWFRNHFCQAEMEDGDRRGIDPYRLMNLEAEAVPIGSNRLLYLPYLMGERTPHLDPDCRGAFVGLSAIHGKADLIRAVMEGVTFSLKDCMELLHGMGIYPTQLLACGGGAVSPLWRQMLADVLDCPVATTTSREGPALGVAILAGVGAGIYKSVAEGCDAIIGVNPPQPPIPEHCLAYSGFYGIYRSLYPALKDSFKALVNL